MNNNTILKNAKIIPQAIELEEAVLGSILIDNRNIDELMEILHTDIFYKNEHKIIYASIKNLYLKSIAIDILTVSQELKKNGKLDLIGGDIFLINLSLLISSSAHSYFHCIILQQKYIARKIITINSELTDKAYDDTTDSLELLEHAYNSLNEITNNANIDDKNSNFSDDVMNYFLEMKQITGLPSSIKLLNKGMNGYADSDLIILAGRPGSGKTAFALNEILNLANNNIPVLLFSLEMSKLQIINRLRSIGTGIDIKKINSKNINPEELHKLKEFSLHLSNLPITIDDRASLNLMQIKIKAKKLMREKNIKMIFVDYLGLIKNNNKNLNKIDQITEISASLKALAKELNVPVMALSQLSREVEKRGDKRPQLSDLRDSGSIEQDADVVAFVFRPEYYNIETWDDDKTPTKDEAEIDIAKFRNGGTFQIRLATDLRYMRFIDLELKYQDINHKYMNKTKKINYNESDENNINYLKSVDPRIAF
jgi:replicative DNA helicase